MGAFDFFFLYDLIIYVPDNNFSVMLERTSAKQGLICLAKGHNTVTPVRLDPPTILSQEHGCIKYISKCHLLITIANKKMRDLHPNYLTR